jgi:hypothetical protein
MSSNTDVNVAVLRHLVARDMDNRMGAAGHGWLYKKFTGLNFSALNKKQLVCSNDQNGDVPASGGWPDTRVCFWVLSNDDDTSGITVKQVGAAVLATITVAAGIAAGQGAFGTTVTQLHDAHSRASQYKVSLPSAGPLGALAMHLAEKSTVKLAKETNNMWALATRNVLRCGAAAISGGPKDTAIYLRYFENKEVMTTIMTRSYRDGRNTPESLKYVRGLCTEQKWQYDADKGSIEKVAGRVELADLH